MPLISTLASWSRQESYDMWSLLFTVAFLSIWYPSCLSSEKEILHSLSKEEKIRLVSREDVKNIINQTPKREVMIWVWFPGKSKAEWTELIANVSKHRRIVTRICMGGFAIIENGKWSIWWFPYYLYLYWDFKRWQTFISLFCGILQ